MYIGNCLYCKNKTDDIMKIFPHGFLMCGNCRALAREHDNTQFMIMQEDVITPSGKVLKPKERFIKFDEKLK